MEPSILIFGFGGYGKMVCELLKQSGHEYIGVFDDDQQLNECTGSGYIFLGKYDSTIFWFVK